MARPGQRRLVSVVCDAPADLETVVAADQAQGWRLHVALRLGVGRVEVTLVRPGEQLISRLVRRQR